MDIFSSGQLSLLRNIQRKYRRFLFLYCRLEPRWKDNLFFILSSPLCSWSLDNPVQVPDTSD